MKKTTTFAIALTLLPILFVNSIKINENRYYYAYDQKVELLISKKNEAIVTLMGEKEKADLGRMAKIAVPNSDPKIDEIKEHTYIVKFADQVNLETFLREGKKEADIHTIQPLFETKDGLGMGITNEIVVRFLDNVTEAQIQNLNAGFKTRIVRKADFYYLLSAPPKADALDIANAYQESGLVRFSHPNFLAETQTFQQHIPNDAFFARQFALHNTGQVINDGRRGTADADIDAPEAWRLSRGVNNIIIAVIDEGVSANHPDLPNTRQVRLNGSNFAAAVDGTNINDPAPRGNSNHGNSCAGAIAATQDNNEGISGVAPTCRIMPIRIGVGLAGAPVTGFADAITFARNNGAHIISNSWGYNSNNPNLHPVIRDAIQLATTQGRGGRGCVVVFAAGNTANHVAGNAGFVSFPANVNIAGVLTVGASDRNDRQANYSPTTVNGGTNNQIVDVVAPSHRAYPNQVPTETFEVWTIDIPGNTGYNPWPAGSSVPPTIGEQLPNAGVNFQAYTGRFGGTSHACPVVAGIAGLILSVNPNLTQQQVFNIITNTADDVGGYAYTGGISREMGAGRANACRAVREAILSTATVTGPTHVCTTPSSFTLNNVPNVATVTWTATPASRFTPSSGTGRTATFQVTSNSHGTGTVIFTIASGCGATTVRRNFNTNMSPVRMAQTTYPGPYANIYAEVDPVPGALSYEWYLNGQFQQVSSYNHEFTIAGTTRQGYGFELRLVAGQQYQRSIIQSLAPVATSLSTLTRPMSN